MISAKIVKGKKIVGYYALEDDTTNGAIYIDLPAVVDGKIIATHHKDMGPWMENLKYYQMVNEKIYDNNVVKKPWE